MATDVTSPEAVEPPEAASVPLIKISLVDGTTQALAALLKQVEDDSGFSILLIPDARSDEALLPENVTAMTSRPVREIKGGEMAEPNTVYLVRPDQHISVEGGRLVVVSRQLKSLAAAIESFPVGMLIADSERRILAINDELKRMSGHTDSDLAAKPIEVLIPEPQHAELQASWASYLRKREPIQLSGNTQLAALRADGREFPVEMSIRQVDPGTDGFVVAAITDVSDRQAAFDALAESERRYEHAVRGTTDGYWVWEVGTQEVFYSARVAELLGYEAAEFGDTLDGFLQRMHPGDKDRVWLHVEQHLETGTDFDVEYRLQCRDGSHRWFRARGIADRDADGKPQRMAGSISDIDDRKQAEHRLQSLLDNSPTAIFVKDLEGRYIEMNLLTAEVMNVTRDEMLGKTDAEVFAPESAAQLRQNDELVARTGEVLKIEENVVTPSGVVPFLSVKYPMYDSTGELFATAGIAIDIQEQKRLEDSIREQVRQRDQFLAMLSHELRNPLAAVVSAVEQIEAEDPVDRAAAAKVIRSQTRDMKRMLDDLLDVARVTRNRLPVHRKPIDVLTTSRHAIECARDAAIAKEITLDVDLPDGVVVVNGDAVRLQQAQVNLLSNAIRFTEKGGHIQFHVRCESNVVRITVSDSGIGLEPERIDHIFETFYQSEQKSDRALGGLGIGLPLTKHIVEAHSGTVTAHSSGPGKGSRFVITLPISDSVQSPESESAGPPDDVSMRIMLIEDNDDLRKMLSRSLQLRGCEVNAFGDGRSSLQSLEQDCPDVVLIDIGLPNMDGYEVVRRIRERCRDRVPLLVALTGYGREEDRVRVRDAGFHLHLVKPVDASEIVRQLIEARKRV